MINMKLFIDSNVVLDFLLGRGDCASVAKIFALAKKGKEVECVSSNSVTDILYTLTKSRKKANQELPEKERKTNKEVAKECGNLLSQFIQILCILPVREDDIKGAFGLEWEDFEDALQYVVARENDCDIIITSNVKDFEDAEISVMSPKTFLESL